MKITQGEIIVEYDGAEFIGVSINGEETEISAHDFKAMANAAYDAWVLAQDRERILEESQPFITGNEYKCTNPNAVPVHFTGSGYNNVILSEVKIEGNKYGTGVNRGWRM